MPRRETRGTHRGRSAADSYAIGGEMPEVNTCWCSASARVPFGSHYAKCGSCGSLVYEGPFDIDDYLIADGETGFYGSRYWKRHVPEVLRLPRLEERARTDLADRSIHYLEGVLEYVAPGSNVLELGCAPGSLAYLMNLSGFRTTGIEMGREVVAFVREQFGVDVLEGPVEKTDLDPTFDAVVMIDVLEHLPLPLTTLGRCAELLTDTGVLILQTPCHRGESPDWSMLIPDEHLFLYTEQSVGQLLGEAGFEVVEVRNALHPHDMWVVASRNEAASPRPAPREGVTPIGAAMIDSFGAVGLAREERDRLATELEASRADQRQQAALIATTDEELKRLREDQGAKEALIVELTDDLDEVRRDQSAKQGLVEELTEELAQVRSDQASKETLIVKLTDELAAVRADQAEKLKLIERVSEELAEVSADQKAKEALIARLTAPAEGAGDGP